MIANIILAQRKVGEYTVTLSQWEKGDTKAFIDVDGHTTDIVYVNQDHFALGHDDPSFSDIESLMDYIESTMGRNMETNVYVGKLRAVKVSGKWRICVANPDKVSRTAWLFLDDVEYSTSTEALEKYIDDPTYK
ncbi:hypothetical protein D1872_51420 [compost metagenome]